MSDSLNLILSLISTVATVIATVLTYKQYKQPASYVARPRKVTPPPLPRTQPAPPCAESAAPAEPTVAAPAPAPAEPAPRSVQAPLRLGGWWLGVACFPWINFLAWAWLGVKTGAARFWGFAVIYGVPFLIFGVMLESAEALHGPGADPPEWTTAMGALSWIVGIFHALRVRRAFQEAAA